MKLNRREFARTAGIKAATIAAVGCGICGCHSAPITGRRQLMLVPEGQEISLGATAYQEAVSAEPLSSDGRMTEIINRVGRRIAEVSG